MNENQPQTNSEGNQEIPLYLRQWRGLYVRQGKQIVEALPEDIAVAKRYPTAKDKGAIFGGKRITILTQKNLYRVNEEVRVIHVMEAVERGHELLIMGPKPICGEYVDGILVTEEKAPEQLYDGPVLESPNVDYNYDITSYRFSELGQHQIYWRIDEMRSNTLILKVVPADQQM
jgi:hypothetical protein